MSFESSVHAKAIELTKLSIEMTGAAGSGHPTSAASLAHLVTVLLYDHMRYDPSHPDAPAADRLVLSEGHACPIVYAAGADLGFPIGVDERRPMTRDDAMTLREIDSPIDGHPNPAEGFPFFPAATGSLGQGLSVAAGMALAARLDGLDRRVFCLIGDGESREGQIWEAVDFLVDHGIAAVLPVFNGNRYGQVEEVSAQQSPEVLEKKLIAAGLDVRVIDGHDPAAIREVLAAHAKAASGSRPMAVVAKTVKGWGFDTIFDGGHHGKPLSDEEQEQAFRLLDERARALGAEWTKGDLEIAVPADDLPPGTASGTLPTFPEALERFGMSDVLEKGKYPTRKAYGVALRALGHADARIVALDGDVRNSTYSEYFADDAELAPRFFTSKIAEQNLVSAAAGLALSGKIPFASSFGKFLDRAYDQMEMAIVSRANLKLVGSHTGVSLAADGPSQMALPDVAFFHAFATAAFREGTPLCHVLTPCDAYSAYGVTLSMAKHDGPCYLRTLRPGTPFVYDEKETFPLGGHKVLAEGKHLLLAAWGYMVHEAKKLRTELAQDGVEATLVDLYSIPFDADAIRELARASGGRVAVIEDNYGAGLGAAVASALAASPEPIEVRQLHVRRIPKSGRTPADVLAHVGLGALRQDISDIWDI